jgi:Lar family restriction alleviation protein
MKLKECPFCGSDAFGYRYEGLTGYGVACENDDCGVGIENFDTRDESMNAWNRRDDTLAEAVRWYLETLDMATSDAMQTWDAVQETINGVWAAKDELRRLVGDA